MNRSHFQKLRFRLRLFCWISLILLAGCSKDFAPNDSFSFNKEIQLYLSPPGDVTYLPASDVIAKAIVDHASCEAQSGSMARTNEISALPARVAWKSGDMEYSAQGVVITVNCDVTIGQEIQPGTYDLRLRLPGLTPVGNLLKVAPRFVSSEGSYEYDATHSSLVVDSFNVHQSQFSKVAVKTGKAIGITILIIGLLVLLFSHS